MFAGSFVLEFLRKAFLRAFLPFSSTLVSLRASGECGFDSYNARFYHQHGAFEFLAKHSSRKSASRCTESCVGSIDAVYLGRVIQRMPPAGTLWVHTIRQGYQSSATGILAERQTQDAKQEGVGDKKYSERIPTALFERSWPDVEQARAL